MFYTHLIGPHIFMAIIFVTQGRETCAEFSRMGMPGAHFQYMVHSKKKLPIYDP